MKNRRRAGWLQPGSLPPLRSPLTTRRPFESISSSARSALNGSCITGTPMASTTALAIAAVWDDGCLADGLGAKGPLAAKGQVDGRERRYVGHGGNPVVLQMHGPHAPRAARCEPAAVRRGYLLVANARGRAAMLQRGGGPARPGRHACRSTHSDADDACDANVDGGKYAPPKGAGEFGLSMGTTGLPRRGESAALWSIRW